MASRQNSSQMLSSSQSSSSNSTNSTSASAKDKTTSHKSSDGKNKQGKVIHKITSESYLRIICEKSSSPNDKKLSLVDKSSSSSTTSGHVPMSSNTIINSMNNMSKQRKGTSFQITSVSVSSSQQQQQLHQRAENNGDDSADDLDESHTDDNISRITDYETPSFSEDTFSREEVFFGQPSAFDTYQVPVIPTSSQYGLAIVGPDLGGNGTNLSDVHVSMTDAGINIIGQIPNKQDVDHKNERFKVVKIESTEPFKRGRWMCMDYLDHTTLQAQDDGIDGSPKDEDENAVKTKDSGLESCLDNGDMEHMSDNDGYDQEVLRAEMQNHHDHHATSHHHTMTSIPIEHPVLPQHAQSMPQGHIEKLISQDMDTSETLPAASQINNTDHSMSVTLQQQQQQHHHAQSMTPEMIQRSLEQNPQFHQGVTLPTNILMQNIGLDQQQQQQHVQQQSQTASIASPIPEGVESSEKQVSGADSVTSQFQQVGTGDNKQTNESESGATVAAAAASATNDNIISNSSVSDNNYDGASPASSAGLGTVTEGGASEVNSATTTTTAATGGDDGQSLNEDSER